MAEEGVKGAYPKKDKQVNKYCARDRAQNMGDFAVPAADSPVNYSAVFLRI